MGIVHFFTDSDFKIDDNRTRIMKERGVDYLHLCGAKQIHSSKIAFVDDITQTSIKETDALITSTPGIGIYVLTADCVPILVEDPRNRVVAAIHAGWKGTAERIAAMTIQKMTEQYHANPHEMKVYIGPHIKACCFEVGNEVVEAIGAEYITRYSINGKPMLNLTQANISQLLSAGIDEKKITVDDRCTCCSNLPSWRREKTNDRIGSIIGITL